VTATPEQVRAAALALPETTERPAWGRPSFRVKDKIFASMPPEEYEVALMISDDEKAGLLAADPETYSVPPHYRNYHMVVVRLVTADPDQLRELLVEAWRIRAPKRLVAAYDRS
jgi:hypothetical protein